MSYDHLKYGLLLVVRYGGETWTLNKVRHTGGVVETKSLSFDIITSRSGTCYWSEVSGYVGTWVIECGVFLTC